MELNQALAETVKILDETDLYWFLEGGTCLGYVRQGRLLEHDNDIDLGVYCPENEIDKIMLLFPVVKINFFRSHPSDIAFRITEFVDIYFFFPFQDQIAETMDTYVHNKIRILGYKKEVILSGLNRVPFEGIFVNTLIKSNQYCEALYGKEYRLPDKKWDAWSSPRNIVPTPYKLDSLSKVV